MLLIAGFAVGFGPLPWVMNVELFSAEARVGRMTNMTTRVAFQTPTFDKYET